MAEEQFRNQRYQKNLRSKKQPVKVHHKGWTFSREITLGSMISWAVVIVSGLLGAYAWVLSVRDSADDAARIAAAAAKQAANVAEQLATDGQATENTIKWMASQIYEIREGVVELKARVVGIERIQDANTRNSARTLERLGGIPAPPPERPPIPEDTTPPPPIAPR